MTAIDIDEIPGFILAEVWVLGHLFVCKAEGRLFVLGHRWLRLLRLSVRLDSTIHKGKIADVFERNITILMFFIVDRYLPLYYYLFVADVKFAERTHCLPPVIFSLSPVVLRFSSLFSMLLLLGRPEFEVFG